MNNIDAIITYLSGEMEQEEARRFELLRSADPELENEFQAILKIWEITRKNLMLEDLPEEKIRDQLIAEILAHHDVEQYQDQALSEKAHAFRLALAKAENAVQKEASQKHSRSKWLQIPTILLAAACLALLFLILRPSTSLQELAVSFYGPAESELAAQHAFKTRSNEARALQFFRDRDFVAAKTYFEMDTAMLDADPMARLFYGISCYETGDIQKARAVLETLAVAGSSEKEAPSAYQAKWYLSLILLKEGNTEKAIPYLVELSRSPGPFNKKSTRLLRKIEINKTGR